MAWFPGAIRKEVRRHRTPLSANGVCEHVAVSEASSLYGYFNQSGRPTSHFYVRKDGTVEQYVSTAYRAPANLEGNDRLISIENQGGVNNANSEPFTRAQRESNAQIIAWVNRVHPSVPLKIMANSKSSSAGIGWHKMGVDPYRVSGGERWSSSYGKICPGQGKINQIPAIVSRAIQINGGELSPTDWLDMASSAELDKLLSAAGRILLYLDAGVAGKTNSILEKLDDNLLARLNSAAGRSLLYLDAGVAGKTNAILARLDELEAKVDAMKGSN